MDSTLNLLKEEINKTMEAEHDLAKWKLGVTAALGAAAFGIGKSPNYWLLLFVPFVCAYIDLYAYQYQLRIGVLAQFLRVHAQDDPVLRMYEEKCHELREEGPAFSLGDWAGIGCSLGASIFGPVFYILQRYQTGPDKSLLVSPWAAGVIWLLGALLIIYLWWYFHAQSAKICEERRSHRAASAA